MLDRIGPPAGGASIRIRWHQRALVDQHVDHAHHRQEIRLDALTALQLADHLPERQRPGEHRQDRVAASPQIDDRAIGGVHEHVSRSIEPSADTPREPQKPVR